MSKQSIVSLDRLLALYTAAGTLDIQNLLTAVNVVGEDQEAEDLLRLARLLKEAQDDFDETVKALIARKEAQRAA